VPLSKDQMQMFILIGVGTFVGSLIKNLMSAQEKPTPEMILRTAFFAAIAIAIAVFAYKKVH